MSAGPSKGAQFLAARIGQDALAMAELLQASEAKDARIAELEAVLKSLSDSDRPKQREKLKKPKE